MATEGVIELIRSALRTLLGARDTPGSDATIWSSQAYGFGPWTVMRTAVVVLPGWSGCPRPAT